MSENKKKIGIVMGSTSDLDTMKETIGVLKELGLDFDVDVVSCHRSPQLAHLYATSAEKRGYEIIIAGAGGAAHIAGFLASLTTLPVIGVPVVNQTLGGLDSLYSMLQMPGGVPVAVTGMGKVGARNAGVLAAEVLSLKDASIRKKLLWYRKRLAKEVEAGAREVKKELD